MAYCPQCGTEVESGAAYCAACGTSLDPGEGTATEGGPGESEAAKGSADEAVTHTEGTDESDMGSGALAGRFWMNSLIGGVVAFVLGLVLATVLGPLYVLGIFGGALLGGYLHQGGVGSGAAVGLVAGIVATIPFILLLAAAMTIGVGGAFASVDPAYYEFTGADLAAAWGFVVVFVGVIGLIFNVIFGVVGGLVGGAIGQ